jgi:ATP adenylyltransferase
MPERARSGGTRRGSARSPRRRRSAAQDSGLDRLWSPWRMAYIRRATSGRDRDCLFCRVAARREDRADLVLVRRPHALLMLNRFPYNPGHLMVAVRRHVGRIADLTETERLELLELTALAERALAAEYRPDGMNLGANVGRVAGAGVLGHFHLHLVPRWNGDTNFVPAIAGTRVLPESLIQTWRRLRRAIARPEVGAKRRTRGAGR